MSGLGPGLTALPVMAVLDWATGDLLQDPKTIWYGAKFVASALVAGSAAFVFLTAVQFTTRNLALLLATSYALATCVWSISSQALWQHGPTEFFLAMGTWLLTRVERGKGPMVGCGLAYAAAVACRPNSAIVCLAVGVYLLVRHRQRSWPCFLGCLPIAVGLAWYNANYLG